jgi:hypothetical protein
VKKSMKLSTAGKNKFSSSLKCFFVLGALIALPPSVSGQIAVNPTGLNVSTQAPTSAFLTFGNLNNQIPAEATWCGELIPATPALGVKCNPTTIFGVIPARYNRTGASGVKAYTDIMTLPASVARRAYQAAAGGATSSFFFVRRFVSTVGGPDEFVVVTCRMSGGSAGSPFSLTNVVMSFAAVEKPILFVREGETLPQIKAEITYTGTGRLIGRWEVVLPGEELPESNDLLTEATLPIEKRGTQRRYTQLSRFNIFLPPDGRYTLVGPKSADLPRRVEGEYRVLLRIEASDDDVTGSNLAVVGAGPGIVNSGAVAGFPLPVLRYFVGAAGDSRPGIVRQLTPADNRIFPLNESVDFAWLDIEKGAFYQVEITDVDGKTLVKAVLPARKEAYRAPSWLRERAGQRTIRWTVRALDENGQLVGESPRRSFSFAPD